ncbi:MotA/TolQ/ExbB proton channel family protein [Singulisphaera sp. PoT]|uniref:MotA/TolQ/ExbB proton channel family protein n=1 Tax=Singulisphaera sp. PoT TaxID=3411797 RepID=UPI003BF55CF4
MSSTFRHTLIAIAILMGLGVFAPAFAQEAAQAPEAAAAAAAQAEGSESFLHWMMRASWPMGLIIAVMSFYLIALVAWMAFQCRRSVAIPASLLNELSNLLGQKLYEEAYQRLVVNTSFLARVLGAGVRKLPSGAGPAQRSMEMANEDATMELEHQTTYLATVGTLGPMIGLVGTVYGMIMSFRVIATAGGSPQASQLAEGISTALFATLEGIALSIPAIYFHSLFRNRIARISLEVALTSETLLEQFAPGIRSLHPLASASTAPVVAAPRPTTALPPYEK